MFLNQTCYKKALRPQERRDAVTFLVNEHSLSVSQSCRCAGLSRSAYYKPVVVNTDDILVINALNELVKKHLAGGASGSCLKCLERSIRGIINESIGFTVR